MMVGAACVLSLQASAISAVLGPDPLAGTPYNTEHDSALHPGSRLLLSQRSQSLSAGRLR